MKDEQSTKNLVHTTQEYIHWRLKRAKKRKILIVILLLFVLTALTVGTILVFTFNSNKFHSYAEVGISVDLVSTDDNTSSTLSSAQFVYDDNSTSMQLFNNKHVQMLKQNYLQYSYTIKNIYTSNISICLSIINIVGQENIGYRFEVNDKQVEATDNKTKLTLAENETVQIKIVVYIVEQTKDASMKANMLLDISNA